MKRIHLLLSYIFYFGLVPMTAQYFNLNHVNQLPDITTFQPPPTLDSSPVCAGSIVDVPFTSSGVYNVLNMYYVQLIDSIGKTAKIDTIGTLPNNVAYTYPPADIVCRIPLTVSTGCHYYMRVICTTPGKVSTEWGPFCIQHCDIVSNEEQNIQTCLQSCAKQMNGYSDTINYTVHEFDLHAQYRPGNKFEVQLISFNLSPASFNILNTGLFGEIVDTISGKILLHVPCADTLNNYGIGPGIYYLRVIADSSSFPDSALGTLVQISIGESADSMYLTYKTFPPGLQPPYCVGDQFIFYANPNDGKPPYNSTYQWWYTDKKYGRLPEPASFDQSSIALTANIADTFVVSCQETNNGCAGNIAVSDTIIVLGAPSVIKTGPPVICLGDTGMYIVRMDSNTLYTWKVYGESYFTILNNTLKIKFDTAGIYKILVEVSNQCFIDSSVWIVHVLSDSLCSASVKNISMLQNVTIYPNPSNGIFQLTINHAELVSGSQSILEVYNTLGEQVLDETLKQVQGDNTINLSSQPNGVYLYRVISENGELVGQGKLIIQR